MNKNLKRLIAITCLVVMSVGFVACGKSNGNGNSGTSNNKEVSDNSESKEEVNKVVKEIRDMNLEKLGEKYTVNLGYYNCDHMTAACIGEDAGIYKELGLDVNVTGNGKVPQAMSAGQMDAGYISFQNVTRGLNVGTPITIAANNHEGGSYYLVVSNDINDPKELIGKKLGIGTEPETGWSWRQMSKDLGIPTEGTNYEGINFDSDQAKYLALKTGEIKGYQACDPWASMAEFEGTGKIMKMFDSVDGQKTICCVFALNTNFMKDHPEVAKRLLLAHTKSIEYLYTNPIKSAKIFAEYYSVPEEVGLMTIYKKTVSEGRTITWDVDEPAIDRRLEENLAHGDYEPVEKSDLIQTELLKESGSKDFQTFIKEEVDPIFPIGMSYDEWLEKAKEIEGL